MFLRWEEGGDVGLRGGEGGRGKRKAENKKVIRKKKS